MKIGRDYIAISKEVTNLTKRLKDDLKKYEGYVTLLPDTEDYCVNFKMGQIKFTTQVVINHHESAIYINLFKYLLEPQKSIVEVKELAAICEGVNDEYSGVYRFKTPPEFDAVLTSRDIDKMLSINFTRYYIYAIEKYIAAITYE